MSGAVKELVVVGRDAPLWLSACVMQCALGPAGVNVTVVELPPRTQPADLCISLPALEALHGRLRIDEARLVAATRAAFTLGRRFIDATGQAPAFFHAHGSNGTRIDKKEFLPQWLKARRDGPVPPFEAFSLTAAAARQGRMLLPDVAVESFGFTDYGYHLPAIPYGAWLRQLASRRGVRSLTARDIEARVDETRGIDELRLDGDRRVTGDFFLDVSGGEATLASALGVGRESWRAAFTVDRVLYGCSELRSALPIHSEVRAEVSGWTALAASQLCVHVQQAYSSELVPEAIARDNAARMALEQVVIRERDPGRRLRAWEKNCVAIGEAACVFDPVHFLDLHSVQVGLVHLLHLFPVQADYGVERDEYNQNVRSSFERMRDFQSAHYLLNHYGLSRADGNFWSRARAVPASAELQHKIDAFRARGECVHYEDEAFTIDDWQALLLGHGVFPESHDPAVERTPAELRAGELARIEDFIRRKVEGQRSHEAYLHSVCAPRAGAATTH